MLVVMWGAREVDMATKVQHERSLWWCILMYLWLCQCQYPDAIAHSFARRYLGKGDKGSLWIISYDCMWIYDYLKSLIQLKKSNWESGQWRSFIVYPNNSVRGCYIIQVLWTKHGNVHFVVERLWALSLETLDEI